MNLSDLLSSSFSSLDNFSIPSVGTFRKVTGGATPGSDPSVLVPPGTKFDFDASLNETNVFVEFISSQYKMGEAQAEKIADMVGRTILSKLKKEGSLKIKGIGTIVGNPQSGISFNSIVTEDAAMYGLPNVNLENARIVENVIEPYDLPPKRKKNRALIWVFASLILLCLLGGIGFLFQDKIKNFYNQTTGIQTVDSLSLTLDSLGLLDDDELDGDELEDLDKELSEGDELDLDNDLDDPISLDEEDDDDLDLGLDDDDEMNSPSKTVRSQSRPKTDVSSGNISNPSTEGTMSDDMDFGTEPSDFSGDLSGVDMDKFYLVAKSFQGKNQAKAYAASLEAKGIYKPSILRAKGIYHVTVFDAREKSQVISKMVQWKNDFDDPKSWIYLPKGVVVTNPWKK